MWSTIWHGFFFDPIYNSLVFFIDVIPGGDVGLAIVFTTVLVKLVLLPLSIKAVKTQVVMREIEPELKAIKEQYKDKREEQAKAMLELYKKAGINPFASIALVFLQIPIIIALYLAVSNGGGVPLPDINTALLYSFIPVPIVTTTIFLGLIDITLKSLPLAALAGITQFIQAKLSIPPPPEKKEGDAPSFKDDLARSMHLQMRYVLPVIIFIVAYTISAAIALYFTISSLMAIAQEYVVRRHKKPTVQ
jgi:YidC/Oxa1 family membrane protein insertase